MVLLISRSRVRSVVLTAVASMLIGVAIGAGGGTEDTFAVGVSESVWHYLKPYYDDFAGLHKDTPIKFVILEDLGAAPAGGRHLIDACVVLDDTSSALGATQAQLGALGMRAVESFDARFVATVSAFNPTEQMSLGLLRMVLAGEIDDWTLVDPGWKGPIGFSTWQSNPADAMITNLLGDARHYVSHRTSLGSYDEFVHSLRLDPYAIAIIPLFRIGPGINSILITGTPHALVGQLVCRAHIYERQGASLVSRLHHWVEARIGRCSALHSFIDYIRAVDAALSGAGSATIVAVGDVMLDRGVRLAMNKHGLTYPFEGTQQVLSSADVAIANLETPISSRGRPLNMFRAYPDVMKALRYSGIDVVSIANNHILDYDDVALFDTLEYLSANGIRAVGAGSDLSAARRPATVSVGRTRIATLAYTELWFCYTKDNRRYDATEANTGVAPLREDVVREDVVRATANSDFVVVSCHWGEEYTHYPNGTQRRVARIAVEAGADVVLGHHPHVLQGIEFGNGSVIAYSLGNFVFDQRHPGTQSSVILRITVSGGRITRTDLIPCYIVECQPVLLSGEARRNALLELHRLSLAISGQ